VAQDALAELLLAEAEVRPSAVGGDDLERRRVRVVGVFQRRDHLRDEVGLRRDGQVPVRVEHQAQEGRARAGDAHDEDRGLDTAGRGAPAAPGDRQAHANTLAASLAAH
jgi:hypothetical protein